MTKQIPLTQGKFALVDDEDYEWASKLKWYSHSCGYAVRTRQFPRRGIEYLHRRILNAPNTLTVDHINGDRFDNRRSNLRLATITQQRYNSAPRKKLSKFKGVEWHKQRGKWYSSITVNYKHISLGLYEDEIEAARAYDIAAKKYYGDFARLNNV